MCRVQKSQKQSLNSKIAENDNLLSLTESEFSALLEYQENLPSLNNTMTDEQQSKEIYDIKKEISDQQCLEQIEIISKLSSPIQTFKSENAKPILSSKSKGTQRLETIEETNLNESDDDKASKVPTTSLNVQLGKFKSRCPKNLATPYSNSFCDYVGALSSKSKLKQPVSGSGIKKSITLESNREGSNKTPRQNSLKLFPKTTKSAKTGYQNQRSGSFVQKQASPSFLSVA